jgi:hypothetical protein
MLNNQNYAALTQLKLPLQADSLKATIRDADRAVLAAIIRMFVTEVIPVAFKECPLAYEHVRYVIAGILETDPKCVGLTGSARLGFATPPQPAHGKKWGTPMGSGSDLDLFVVDGKLFKRCVDDVNIVGDDKAFAESVDPDDLARYRDKVANLRKNSLPRGFFDVRHLPHHSALLTVKKIREAMQEVERAFSNLPFKLIPKEKPSLRVYKNWDAAIAQIAYNLKEASRAAIER